MPVSQVTQAIESLHLYPSSFPFLCFFSKKRNQKKRKFASRIWKINSRLCRNCAFPTPFSSSISLFFSSHTFSSPVPFFIPPILSILLLFLSILHASLLKKYPQLRPAIKSLFDILNKQPHVRFLSPLLLPPSPPSLPPPSDHPSELGPSEDVGGDDGHPVSLLHPTSCPDREENFV